MTGLTEAAVTGICEIRGSPAVLIVLDFGFLGGSMGCVVGEKVALAFEAAQKKKLPLVAIVTSGGARIQEGVLSLMQMAKTTAAAKRLQEAGIPFISVLANPTSGHVYASFANMADIILAEPEALIGFAPLREVEEHTTEPLPKGSHTAESHLEHGMIDMVVEREQLTDLLSVLADLLSSKYKLTLREKGKRPSFTRAVEQTAWERVRLARHKDRPTSLDYISRISSSFIELSGDRVHGDDPAVVFGLGYVGGQPVVIVGQERGHAADVIERNEGRSGPEGFRKAQRAMRIAARFNLPLVTFIDTPGALPSLESEERGLGNSIASTMALLSDLPTPVISDNHRRRWERRRPGPGRSRRYPHARERHLLPHLSRGSRNPSLSRSGQSRRGYSGAEAHCSGLQTAGDRGHRCTGTFARRSQQPGGSGRPATEVAGGPTPRGAGRYLSRSW